MDPQGAAVQFRRQICAVTGFQFSDTNGEGEEAIDRGHVSKPLTTNPTRFSAAQVSATLAVIRCAQCGLYRRCLLTGAHWQVERFGPWARGKIGFEFDLKLLAKPQPAPLVQNMKLFKFVDEESGDPKFTAVVGKANVAIESGTQAVRDVPNIGVKRKVWIDKYFQKLHWSTNTGGRTLAD